jgi:hypothetical protein
MNSASQMPERHAPFTRVEDAQARRYRVTIGGAGRGGATSFRIRWLNSPFNGECLAGTMRRRAQSPKSLTNHESRQIEKFAAWKSAFPYPFGEFISESRATARRGRQTCPAETIDNAITSIGICCVMSAAKRHGLHVTPAEASPERNDRSGILARGYPP